MNRYSRDVPEMAGRAKEAEGEGLFADLLRRTLRQEAALPGKTALPKAAGDPGRPDAPLREPAADGGDRPAALPAPARPAPALQAASPSTAVSGSTPSRRPVVDRSGALYEQCEALETFLIKNLLSSMRNTVQKSGLVEEGFAGRMYEDMLYDEYAKVYAKNAGFGFAEMAYLELTGQRGKVIAR
jgi:flagellar protein FlgJ